jgi:hypothetical protein
MSIVVGDILRVVAVLSWLDGDIAQNVFNAVISGSGGPFDDADIVADALDWLDTMYANIVTQMSDEIDGSEIRLYIYDPIDDDWDEVGSDAWSLNPSGVSDQLPRGVAQLVNCKTLDPDVNGKKYLPAPTEGIVTDGLFIAGAIADATDFAVDWVTGFTGATSGASWVPGVWSPTNTNFHPMSGTVILPTIPAYQRRRKRGIGI